MPDVPPALAVVGATATGKSAVGVALAHALDGEVINADAMQFYRGMDIGTAKLSLEEREGIAHHQLDTLSVAEDASVAHYQVAGRADIASIHARSHRAIVVGGSGLYVRALLDDFEFPPTDPEVRSRLEQRAEHEGPGVLHRELSHLDPPAAARIDARNAKRIVRALEVIELTGRPFTSSLPTHRYAIPAVQIGLRAERDVLDARIDARVARMWESGLVDEVRDLEGHGLREGVTARRAVGYAETLRHLDGELSAEQAQSLIAQHTRRLARRQERWFGPDSRITWVDAPVDADDVARVVAQILEVVGPQR